MTTFTDDQAADSILQFVQKNKNRIKRNSLLLILLHNSDDYLSLLFFMRLLCRYQMQKLSLVQQWFRMKPHYGFLICTPYP